MNYYIVIPAHNEEEFLAKTLDSVTGQTLLPKMVVVVNDNSTDQTGEIIDRYANKYPFIQKITTKSSSLHLPGSKVVNAFNAGLAKLDEDYDFIVKLDADLILPEEYFEKIAAIFKARPSVGIAGGFFHEKDDSGQWQLSHPMDKSYVRGAFKAYTRECFASIGGLKNAMGWDTLDELLARYHGFETYTDDSMVIKNLRPVGQAYDKKARYLQGIAMYRMGYGFWLSMIASLKMSWIKRKPQVFINNLIGYFRACLRKSPLLVSEDEKAFIRKYRWSNIKRKLF